MNTHEYNRQAWNAQVRGGEIQWTIGVKPEEIARARLRSGGKTSGVGESWV